MPESKEAQDEQAAVNFLISQGAAGQVTSAPQLEGLTRADAIQKSREGAAAKLEALRDRGNKIMLPLPAITFFSEPLLRQIYGTRKPGEQTYFTTEDSQSLTATQAIIAMNQLLSSSPGALALARRFLRESSVPILKPDQTAGPNVLAILRSLAGALAGGGTIQLPFVGKTIDLSVASGNYEALATALDRIKTSGSNQPPAPEIPPGAGNPEGISDAAFRSRPPKSGPSGTAALWVSWAVGFGVALPHTKTSLVARFR